MKWESVITTSPTHRWAGCEWKGLERPKERPRDSVQGFPGTDLQLFRSGWLEEVADHCHGQGGNCLYGVRGQKLCACQREYVIYDYTTCFVRRDHSCATSAPEN